MQPQGYITFTTLNYSLSHDLARRLDDYCYSTGRNASEVVRQLVLEYVEGDRRLTRQPAQPTSATGRSSVRLNSTTYAAFERQVDLDGHASKGTTLEGLLRAFLERAPKGEEKATVSVPISLTALRVASERASLQQRTLGDFLTDIVEKALAAEPAKKES